MAAGPLMAKRGALETVREGLDSGMPVAVTLPPKDPRYPYTVRTPLEAASIYARMEVVNLLLDRGATLRRDERYGGGGGAGDVEAPRRPMSRFP